MRSLRSIGRARTIQILVTGAVALLLAVVVSDAFGLRSPEPVSIAARPPSTTGAPSTTSLSLPATVPTVVIPSTTAGPTTVLPGDEDSGEAPAVPVAEEVVVAIALVHPSGGLVDQERIVLRDAAPISALNALLIGPTDGERMFGIDTAIPSGAAVLDVALDDGVFTVDLSASFAERLTTASAPLAVAQVVCTVDGFTGVDAVQLQINGEVRADLRGVGVGEPRTCDDVRPGVEPER